MVFTKEFVFAKKGAAYRGRLWRARTYPVSRNNCDFLTICAVKCHATPSTEARRVDDVGTIYTSDQGSSKASEITPRLKGFCLGAFINVR